MLVADSGFAVTIDQIAESLRHDHVLVQEVIGNGDAQGAHDRLSRVVERLQQERGLSAYVVLAMQPRDVDAGIHSAEYLAQALHKRLKQPGIYVVELTGGTMVVDALEVPGVNDTDLDLHYYGNERALVDATADDYAAVGDEAGTLAPSVDAEVALLTATHSLEPVETSGSDDDFYWPPTLTKSELADLAQRQVALEPPYPDSDHSREPLSTGARWMIGGLVGILVLLVVQQTLRGWPGWRRRPQARTPAAARVRAAAAPPEPAAQLQRARTLARAELRELTRTLPDAADGDPAMLRSATAARDLAEQLLGSDRLEDVVGAYTLAATARSDVDRATDPSLRAVRCCFFNPLHGAATRTTTSDFGDARVGVPACRACARAVAAGKAPKALEVPARFGSKPYYETDSVWARTGFGSLVDDYADRVLAERRRR